MRTSRIGIVAVMIVALLGAGFTRQWAEAVRASNAKDLGAMATDSQASLANMNSFSLALLLGGLRGPLVMFLWTQSENMKNEKNLEDFDTLVEWIRLLQPEFDTVHIFQVWNKAYNVSVQMANVANKYTTILDAIDYAARVEAERPNNINMLYAIGGIYFDKLGNSSEKAYYKRRVREESKPHASRQKVDRNDPAWRRLELDPVLDQSGMLLPNLLKEKYPRPANLPPDSEWNTGAEMQYLAPYQPFPYGVSTMGFALAYHKRAEVLQNVLKQKHAQLSELVVDSRPALTLKGWAEDEWERGRTVELTALNHPVPEERGEMELPTAETAVDVQMDAQHRAMLAEAIYSYNLGARLDLDAIAEYKRHLKNFTVNLTTYSSHMDEVHAASELMAGDRDYLKAMLETADARTKLLTSAKQHYNQAAQEYRRIILKYYIDDELAQAAFPPGLRRSNIDEMPPEFYGQAIGRVLQLAAARGVDPSGEDRMEFLRYLARAESRLKRIGGNGPATRPR